MTETWRPIPGWPYLTSSTGKVKRLTGHVLKPQSNVKGYLYLTLQDGGRKRSISVAACVCEAFIGPRPEGMHVAHLDGDRLNNTADNLAYVTPRENEAHKRAHGTCLLGEKNNLSKLTKEDVEYIRQNLRVGSPQFGFKALGRRFGVYHTTIMDVANGRTWKEAEG